MVHILELPEEVLSRICEYYVTEARKDFDAGKPFVARTPALVCTRLQDTYRPVLWSHPHLYEQSIPIFTRSLASLKHPAHVKAVRNLTVTWKERHLRERVIEKVDIKGKGKARDEGWERELPSVVAGRDPLGPDEQNTRRSGQGYLKPEEQGPLTWEDYQRRKTWDRYLPFSQMCQQLAATLDAAHAADIADKGVQEADVGQAGPGRTWRTRQEGEEYFMKLNEGLDGPFSSPGSAAKIMNRRRATDIDIRWDDPDEWIPPPSAAVETPIAASTDIEDKRMLEDYNAVFFAEASSDESSGGSGSTAAQRGASESSSSGGQTGGGGQGQVADLSDSDDTARGTGTDVSRGSRRAIPGPERSAEIRKMIRIIEQNMIEEPPSSSTSAAGAASSASTVQPSNPVESQAGPSRPSGRRSRTLGASRSSPAVISTIPDGAVAGPSVATGRRETLSARASHPYFTRSSGASTSTPAAPVASGSEQVMHDSLNPGNLSPLQTGFVPGPRPPKLKTNKPKTPPKLELFVPAHHFIPLRRVPLVTLNIEELNLHCHAAVRDVTFGLCHLRPQKVKLDFKLARHPPDQCIVGERSRLQHSMRVNLIRCVRVWAEQERLIALFLHPADTVSARVFVDAKVWVINQMDCRHIRIAVPKKLKSLEFFAGRRTDWRHIPRMAQMQQQGFNAAAHLALNQQMPFVAGEDDMHEVGSDADPFDPADQFPLMEQAEAVAVAGTQEVGADQEAEDNAGPGAPVFAETAPPLGPAEPPQPAGWAHLPSDGSVPAGSSTALATSSTADLVPNNTVEAMDVISPITTSESVSSSAESTGTGLMGALSLLSGNVAAGPTSSGTAGQTPDPASPVAQPSAAPYTVQLSNNIIATADVQAQTEAPQAQAQATPTPTDTNVVAADQAAPVTAAHQQAGNAPDPGPAHPGMRPRTFSFSSYWSVSTKDDDNVNTGVNNPPGGRTRLLDVSAAERARREKEAIANQNRDALLHPRTERFELEVDPKDFEDERWFDFGFELPMELSRIRQGSTPWHLVSLYGDVNDSLSRQRSASDDSLANSPYVPPSPAYDDYWEYEDDEDDVEMEYDDDVETEDDAE